MKITRSRQKRVRRTRQKGVRSKKKGKSMNRRMKRKSFRRKGSETSEGNRLIKGERNLGAGHKLVHRELIHRDLVHGIWFGIYDVGRKLVYPMINNL